MEFARRAGGQVVTNVACFRSLPDPLGIVLLRGKLEFVEVSARPGQHCHSEKVAHYFCGNLHRIWDYLSSSIRRGRVSRPPEFRDLYGAGRETRPLRCFYGWPAKFQFDSALTKQPIALVAVITDLKGCGAITSGSLSGRWSVPGPHPRWTPAQTAP